MGEKRKGEGFDGFGRGEARGRRGGSARVRGSAGAGGVGACLARLREVVGTPDGWAPSGGERGREGGGGATVGSQMGQFWSV